MAAGFDKLLDFLLSEVALRGIQGASSADIHRFIEKFYEHVQADGERESGTTSDSNLSPNGLSRRFYEHIWQWLTDHTDIRIIYQKEVRLYTLSEFEAAELHEASTIGETTTTVSDQPTNAPTNVVAQPSKALSALEGALRQRILKEGQGPKQSKMLVPQAQVLTSLRRLPRNIPEGTHATRPIFDEPDSSITAPRLYASQSRIWQALTGHVIDLKKVPSMEFVLLSIIAARGADGITQPELTSISGQDKRSVPHRTDELARKNYILKYPVQANKMRTSLCVHTKFVSQTQSFVSSAVEDVYQPDTFVVTGFPQLLYNTLKNAGIVPTRNLRSKLNVPMTSWHKRATQGALIRLDQSGMIKRFRVRKNQSINSWTTCIQVLREPRDEDRKNLGFRRQLPAHDETTEELLDEHVDGDTLMRDLEVDVLDDAEVEVDARANAQHAIEASDRIPPQWTPERFFANIVFDAVALGGVDGWDAEVLRDRIVGPFWRRPVESYFTRLSEDWEKTQPFPLRHLAVIRDQRNTDEKKYLHYVYRTYANVQKAVEAGVVHWAGVSNPNLKEAQDATDGLMLDAWGFQVVEPKDLVRGDGSASLSEVCSAVVKPRKYGPRWDNALAQAIGYQKSDMPIPKKPIQSALDHPRKPSKSKEKPKRREKEGRDLPERTPKVPKVPKSTKKAPVLSLTPEQRTSLGLKPNGRLSRSVEVQIFAYRQKTGDPTSLPDKIQTEPVYRGLRAPLMTAEERMAAGLPARGRLGIAIENEIREERGLAKLSKKEKKKETKLTKEPTLLSKQQRTALGWKGHGRLPQALIEGLRQEREDGIALEDSKVIAQYMDEMLAKAGKPAASEPTESAEDQAALVQGHNVQMPPVPDVEAQAPSPPAVYEKRKATDTATSSPLAKKRRKEPSQEDIVEIVQLQLPVSLEIADPPGGGTQVVEPDEDRTSGAIPIPAAEDTQLFQLATPPVEDDVVPSVEAQPPPTSVVKKHGKPSSLSPAILHPDASSLDFQARTVFDRYTSRLSPGLYVNPYAKRKVPRGRPRNAMIATFKLPHLASYEWFKADPSQAQASAPVASTPRSPESSRMSVAQQEEGSISAAPVRSNVRVKSKNETDTHGDDASGSWQSSAAKKSVSHEPIVSPAVNDNDTGEQLQSAPHSGSTIEGPVTPSTTVTASTGGGCEQSNDVSEVRDRQPSRQALSVPHVVAGWTPINPSAQQSVSSYKSPYAPSVRSESTPLPQAANTTIEGYPIAGTSNNFPLPQGVYSAIVEAEAPPLSKSKAKMKNSTLAFRRDIILEIIDLCNGVFPDGGEIGKPFHAIWQRKRQAAKAKDAEVKDTKEPSPGTVIDTLRDMCRVPRFGLKRWTFAVQNKGSPFTHTRSMITRTHLTERSPEVLALAYNMANFSHEKSHQYFPEEIRHLVDTTSMYLPLPAAPKDESIILNQLNPELEEQIREAKRRHRVEYNRQRKLEVKARKAQNAQVEQVPSRQLPEADGAPRTKRARLASLNDKSKQFRRAPLHKAGDDLVDEEDDDSGISESEAAKVGNSRQISLIWTRPIVAPIPERESIPENSDAEETDDEPAELLVQVPQKNLATNQVTLSVALPAEPAHAPNGASAAHSDSARENIEDTMPQAELPAEQSAVARKGKKRVRIADPCDQSSKKRTRLSIANTAAQDGGYYEQSSTENDASLSSEAEENEEEDGEVMQPKTRKRGVRAYNGRQRGKLGPPPTLLERLTGLTGDPNDPIYQPPQRKSRPGPTWSERKIRANRQKKERKYAEILDPVDKFKKLFCVFVVASSMSEEDGVVDWSVVERVYGSDKFFDVAKAKKLWSWMQMNMVKQVHELTKTFQSSFLEAYETDKVAAIEDASTHDWLGLVRWAVRTCTYPELPLSALHEAYRLFTVDESSYENLDRVKWYKNNSADRARTLLQLQHSFSAPLHRSRKAIWSAEDKVLKARAWIRANTATPQALYDANLAHDKFQKLGESVLISVVGDFVEKQHLRMRKTKRLLPGRNYEFTHALARKYVRPFQLSDFMDAVKVKKEMDAAFSNEDPGTRSYIISRSEEDGSVTAIMTMVSEGTVKLMPQLPHVNNEFDAPLPRLSVWGFCEGDYNHRAIDRERLFWDIHVVPTENYQFGNPLQPQMSPLSSTQYNGPAVWPALPDPPLPGKHDANALLPIWSSIDGQAVTLPWWYRILNLVLQPLIFLAGATAADIHSHCPENTTEVFEIELVLGWLESVNAVKKEVGGGYVVLPGFWAAFGDKPLETEGDDFGKHVKRNMKRHEKQQWREAYGRDAYNLRHSKRTEDVSVEPGEAATATQDTSVAEPSTSQQILNKPKQQYSIIGRARKSQQSPPAKTEGSTPTATPSPAAIQEHNEQVPTTEETRANVSQTPESISTPGADVDMADADANVDDVDAEGEEDDEY
ncbi:hypothetical protein EJ02DRAFT_436720 [Clathrospora elynae]|uniref:Uncharacterized protein n=1 Tax=Clathrospora elynae TaxID=706981 RepID=A0A6A5SE88_9PLEO|nr:hypothetical protein EJ02DRAFT_436720 [Clathrospora elynae]